MAQKYHKRELIFKEYDITILINALWSDSVHRKGQ